MRRALITLALAALTVATAAPAGAQTATEAYRAEGDAAGVEVTLFDQDPIRIADSAATIDTAPLASALGLGLSLSDDSRSQAEVTSSGNEDREPESCVLPSLPAPLDAIVDLDQVCSAAIAELIDLPSATGTAELLGADVNGEQLAEQLGAVALEPVADQAAGAYDQVQNSVLDPIYSALVEACAQVPGAGGITDLPLEQIPDELDPIVGALPADNPCSVLVSLLGDPPIIDDASFVTDLTTAFQDAIAQVDVLSFVVASNSEGTATADAASGSADYTTVSATLPSLSFLDAVLDAVASQVLQPFLDELDTRLEPVQDVVPELPTLTETLTSLRDQLDLDILTSQDPLLTLQVLDSGVSATYDRTAGEVSTAGGAGLITVTLSSALADLFGVEREQQIAAGQSQTLLEGTPLASTLSVGSTETTEATHEGLSGKRITAQAADLQLVTGAPGGGIRISLGTVSAAAFGQPGAAPAGGEGPSLPTTGGGFVLASLAALGGSLLLRRRG